MARKPRQRSAKPAATPASQPVTPASQQEYLATELGHEVDHEGEPSGLEVPSGGDANFREFTIGLWRQVQASRSVQGQLREMEQEGLAAADIWAPGITETLPTSSSAEDIRRYKQKLLFRANVLEAALTETISELKGLERIRPRGAGKATS
jgi:hypothetical protein